MNSDISKIEGGVFRMMNMDDGLMDVYLGIMLIPYASWIFRPDSTLSPVITVLIAYSLAYPFFMYLKKKVVTPRVGSIKPGPIRLKKTHLMLVVSIVAVVLTVALVLMTIFASGSAGNIIAGIPRVFWIFSASVIVATILTAWIANTARLAVYGLMAAVSIPIDAVFLMRTGFPPSTLIPILAMIGTGVVFFVRFLNDHPVHTEVELG